MLKDVVNILKDISLRHKGVRTFKYQGDDLFNAQNNYGVFQAYLDDISHHQLNITTNVFKVEFNLYILGFVKDNTPEQILEVQNNAYTIACDIIAKIDNTPEYNNILSVHDYDILTLSHFTDDNSAGVKLSLELSMPNPVNLCSLDENFNDTPYQPEPDHEIDIPTDEIGEIDLKTIKLPINNRC